MMAEFKLKKKVNNRVQLYYAIHFILLSRWSYQNKRCKIPYSSCYTHIMRKTSLISIHPTHPEFQPELHSISSTASLAALSQLHT